MKDIDFDEYLISAMFCVLVAFAFSVLLFGCATIKDAGVRPAGCEDSLIYDKVPQPDLVGVGLMLAVSETSLQYPQARPYIAGAIDALTRSLAGEKPTYAAFALEVFQDITWINQNFGARLVLIKPVVLAFDSPLPISSCDLALIRNHLAMQKAALTVR
jgi:hypothetical protein